MGLGYIGLPTAVTLATKGYKTFGYDINGLLFEPSTNLGPHLRARINEALEQAVLVGISLLQMKSRPATFMLFVCLHLSHLIMKALQFLT